LVHIQHQYTMLIYNVRVVLLYTLGHKKTCHFILGYNFRVSSRYTSCTNGNRNEYSTMRLLGILKSVGDAKSA